MPGNFDWNSLVFQSDFQDMMQKFTQFEDSRGKLDRFLFKRVTFKEFWIMPDHHCTTGFVWNHDGVRFRETVDLMQCHFQGFFLEPGIESRLAATGLFTGIDYFDSLSFQ